MIFSLIFSKKSLEIAPAKVIGLKIVWKVTVKL